MAQSETAVLDDDNRSCFKCVAALAQDAKQPRSQGIWRLIPHPEQDDTRNGATTRRQEFSKIEIACQDYPLLSNSLIEDLSVWHGMKALFAKVNRFVAHVSEKLHATGLVLKG